MKRKTEAKAKECRIRNEMAEMRQSLGIGGEVLIIR